MNPVDQPVTIGPATGSAALAWMDHAACHGMNTDDFFPDTDDGEQRAQMICARCHVRDDCATYALANDELRGVWGGLTERDRRHLRRATWDPPRERQPGPPPAISDAQLLELLRAADPERPAAEHLRRHLGVSVPTIYKYLQRARALGAVEHRGRNLYPRPR